MIGRHYANTVLCTPLLLALDSMVFSIRINGAVVHNAFIIWGAFGATRTLSYNTGLLIPPAWYLLITIPLFAVGWLHVSRWFFFSTLYSALAVAGISK